jgi:TonB family protein
MRIVLIQPKASLGKAQGMAKISFDGGSVVEVGFWSIPLQSKEMHVTIIDLKRADLNPLKTAKQLRIRARKVDVSFVSSMFGPALKALSDCEKDLLARWGMDLAIINSIQAYPEARGGVHSFFRTDDYPSAAIRNEEQGTAGVRFWVSEEGRVRDCKVVESSGSAALDAQTCAMISKRGRYEPARTKTGDVVESISYARIRWEMPGN